jgi:hypothetical protein
MTKPTRVFLGVAIGILVVGAAVGAVATFTGLPVLAQLGGTRQELQYVPADARLVAFANVRDLMDSELRQKLLELNPRREPIPDAPDGTNPDGSPRVDFLRDAGIDPERDVDAVVVAFLGPSGDENDRPLLLAKGRFDDDLIETVIRQRGGQVEEYGGVRLLSHREDDRAVALAFVEPDLVAAGALDSVRRAIDVKAGSQPGIATNPQVMAMIGDVDDGNAWAVGRFDALRSAGPLPEQMASQLPAINWFAASGHVNGGIDGLLRVEARDEAAAQNLRDVLQGFLALARLQAGPLEQFRGLLESVTLGGQGTTVSMTFSVPASAIDALAALRNERRGARAPSGSTPNSVGPSAEGRPSGQTTTARPPRT